MPNRATIELLDRLRVALGTPGHPCSDYRVGKELGVTHTAVSKWRTGDSHMSAENVLAACELAGLGSAAFYWNYRVSAERDSGRVQAAAVQVIEEFEGARRGRKPRPDGLLALLTRKSKYVAAALLAFGLAGAPPPAQAASVDARALYIMTNRRRSGPGLAPA